MTKTGLRAAALGVALMTWAGAAAADPVHGTWKTVPDDNGAYGHIQVKPCGDKICGTLVKAFEKDGKAGGQDHIGKNIIWDMSANGAANIPVVKSGRRIATKPIARKWNCWTTITLRYLAALPLFAVTAAHGHGLSNPVSCYAVGMTSA